MHELALIPLILRADARERQSALPNSPVVPEPSPGRVRLSAAAALHRIASRLDGGRPSPGGYAGARVIREAPGQSGL